MGIPGGTDGTNNGITEHMRDYGTNSRDYGTNSRDYGTGNQQHSTSQEWTFLKKQVIMFF